MYVSQLTIPETALRQRNITECVCDYVVWLYQPDAEKADQLARRSCLTEYFENLLNGLLYELFFPDDLHSRGVNLFEHVEKARLPAMADIPAKQRLSRLEEIYDRISNDRNPIRGCLESLKSVEVVRIIEGRA